MIIQVEPLLIWGLNAFIKVILATLGGRLFRAQSIVFLLWGEFCGEVEDVSVEVDILCYTLAFFAFWRLIVIFQKRGLEYFVQHSVYSCWSWFQNHFCTILKPLIGLVPIGEGLGDIAQWRGWTPLSSSVCDSHFLFQLVSVSVLLLFISVLSIQSMLMLFHELIKLIKRILLNF